VVEGNVWFIGGCDRIDPSDSEVTFIRSILVLSLSEGTWREIDSPSLPPLAGHSASVVGTIVYIAGGIGEGGVPNRTLFTWDTVEERAEAADVFADDSHTHHQSVCVSRLNVLFFTCRLSPQGSTRFFNMIHFYDIKNRAWLPLPSMAGTPVPQYRERYTTW
jgi:hypothetical protein